MIIGIAPLSITFLNGQHNIGGNFDTIKFFGNNTGIILDNIWGRNMEITNEYWNSLSIETYKPSWTLNTYLLAMFQESLNAGNIASGNEYFDSWSIYRRTDNNEQLEFINDIPISQLTYKDYTALIGHVYQYYIFAKSKNVLSSPLISNEITVNYNGNYLIDVNNQKTYVININVESGAITQNEEYTMHNVNNKYNVFMKGNNQYFSTNISGILTNSVDSEGVINNSVEILQEFNDFVHDNNILKYYKNRKGQIFNVFTSDSNMSVLNDNIGSQPMVVSVTVTEKGKV